MNGVLPAILTPFARDGSPDLARLIAFGKSLLEAGCTGLALFGTTGEGTSLSVDEREALLAGLIEGGINPAQLIAGTGSSALPDTVRLTRAAVRAGCAGALILPPFYYKDVTDEGVYRCYSEIVERVGDARLRLYLYHFPQLSGISIRLPVIERLLIQYPRAIGGIKDSSGDPANLAALIEAFPTPFEVFTGTERLLSQALRAGGAGTITAMGNAAPREISALYRGYMSNGAGELQRKADAARVALTGLPTIAALKALVAQRLSDPEWRRVRAPLVEFDGALPSQL